MTEEGVSVSLVGGGGWDVLHPVVNTTMTPTNIIPRAIRLIFIDSLTTIPVMPHYIQTTLHTRYLTLFSGKINSYYPCHYGGGLNHGNNN